MKRIHSIVTILVILPLLASACSSQGGSGSTSGDATSAPAGSLYTPTVSPTFTPMDTATPVPGPATVTVGKSDKLGSYLTDDKGMTLYSYIDDTPGTSTCDGQCSYYWPPLLTTGAPIAGTGADGTKLGTFVRSDGTTQVIYNGLPLYYYRSDTNPGDTTGQNYQERWNMVTPTGDKIK